MIVHAHGGYETGSWLTLETYPDSYFIDDSTEVGRSLIAKIIMLYPYYTLEVIDGVLVDVISREKTPTEIEAETTPPPKSAEQLRIEQLESDNLMLMMAVFDLYSMLAPPEAE